MSPSTRSRQAARVTLPSITTTPRNDTGDTLPVAGPFAGSPIRVTNPSMHDPIGSCQPRSAQRATDNSLLPDVLSPKAVPTPASLASEAIVCRSTGFSRKCSAPRRLAAWRFASSG